MGHGGDHIADDGFGGETLAATAAAALIFDQPLSENHLLLSRLASRLVILW